MSGHRRDGPPEREPSAARPLRTTVRDLARINHRYVADLVSAAVATVRRGPGDPAASPQPVAASDRRFDDPAWSTNSCFHLLQQSYLLNRRYLLESLATLPLAAGDGRIVRFAAEFAMDALAPTNFLAGNPAALRRAVETRGRSLLRGAANFLTDLTTNGGLPPMTDSSRFVLGRDMAATPGKVVLRNQLMELIQYEPRTATVHTIPMLISPAWVNKYYIFDLSPELSIVKWLVEHGHTVFTISYRNPDRPLRETGFEHYLRDGLMSAAEAVGDITGAKEVNITGGCLGGLLALMLAAWPGAEQGPRVRGITTVNAPVDFADLLESGFLGSRAGELIADLLGGVAACQGYLTGRGLDAYFRSLRANDAIWKYVASNWLMGRSPSAFRLLAWSSDAMNVPRRTLDYLLRDLWLRNSFAGGNAEIGGRSLRLDRVKQDLFIVAGREDHLIPWESSYRAAALFPGDSRFLLASGGHIGSVLASPGYWTGDRLPSDPAAWLAEAGEHRRSWWLPWTRWLAERAGPQRPPPPTGSIRYPAREDAPGTFVHM